jgi:predicted metal-dependent phosphoesterase TrpH
MGELYRPSRQSSTLQLLPAFGLLSITDHNNDKHVLTSLTYGAKYADRLLVVPGVEISTAHGHLLVYGDPSKRGAFGDTARPHRA